MTWCTARGAAPGTAPAAPRWPAVAGALDGADVVLLAVPGGAVAGLVGADGAGLAGKVIIDAANRIGEGDFNSRAEIAKAAPGARYVRAFNTLGWENFASRQAGAALFFAADPAARPVAEELISAVGLEPAYVGEAARPAPSTRCCRCGSPWSSRTAGTANWPSASSVDRPRPGLSRDRRAGYGMSTIFPVA